MHTVIPANLDKMIDFVGKYKFYYWFRSIRLSCTKLLFERNNHILSVSWFNPITVSQWVIIVKEFHLTKKLYIVMVLKWVPQSIQDNWFLCCIDVFSWKQQWSFQFRCFSWGLRTCFAKTDSQVIVIHNTVRNRGTVKIHSIYSSPSLDWTPWNRKTYSMLLWNKEFIVLYLDGWISNLNRSRWRMGYE